MNRTERWNYEQSKLLSYHDLKVRDYESKTGKTLGFLLWATLEQEYSELRQKEQIADDEDISAIDDKFNKMAPKAFDIALGKYLKQ